MSNEKEQTPRESVITAQKQVEALTPLAPSIRPPDHFTTICFHGLTGSSKTDQIRHLIQAFGRDQVVVISSERGLAGLADLEPLQIELLSKEDYQTLPPEQLLKRYVTNMKRAILYLKQNVTKHKWWAFDAANEAASIMEQRGIELLEKGTKYKSQRGKPDPRKMYADLWRIQASTFRDCQMLPMNGFINSLTLIEEEKERTDGGEEKVIGRTLRPWLAGRKILDAYAPKWDSVCYAHTRTVQDITTPGKKFKKFLADTQGNSEGFEKIVARTRMSPLRPIPRTICLGLLDPNGLRVFDPQKHWSIVRLWSMITGMPMPEYKLTSDAGALTLTEEVEE